jgi:hypothetical protein
MRYVATHLRKDLSLLKSNSLLAILLIALLLAIVISAFHYSTMYEKRMAWENDVADQYSNLHDYCGMTISMGAICCMFIVGIVFQEEKTSDMLQYIFSLRPDKNRMFVGKYLLIMALSLGISLTIVASYIAFVEVLSDLALRTSDILLLVLVIFLILLLFNLISMLISNLIRGRSKHIVSIVIVFFILSVAGSTGMSEGLDEANVFVPDQGHIIDKTNISPLSKALYVSDPGFLMETMVNHTELSTIWEENPLGYFNFFTWETSLAIGLMYLLALTALVYVTFMRQDVRWDKFIRYIPDEMEVAKGGEGEEG